MKVPKVIYAAASAEAASELSAAVRREFPGAEVERVEELAAAEAALAAGDCDLLACDYRLPAFDALALLHLRNTAAPGVPAIILSGDAACDKCQELMRLGADWIVPHVRSELLPGFLRLALAGGRGPEAEEARRERMEALGRLAGSVAHDFNNIMGAIEGYATLNIRNLREGDPLRADLCEIRKAVAKAADLNRQLLLFSRSYPVPQNPVRVEELEAGLRAAFPPGAAVGLEFSAAPGLPPAGGSLGELSHALLNLALNARDAMPGGGTVRITAEADPGGEFLRLSVSDRGPGIPPEALPRIFDPFFTTKPKGKGVGLGLSAVYGIVRRHKGRVDVKTSPAGSTFTLVLPVFSPAREPGDAPAAVTAVKICQAASSVLLIEDDADLLAIAARGLAAAGYKVLQAGTLAAALDLLRRRGSEVCAVLADIVLPDGRATDAAPEILALAPGACLVFISGYDQREEIKKLIPGRSLRFLQKPYSIEALLACLADCVKI
jgi:signal transduction histidine kinase/ActR/RegA family two-component response regulator